MSCSLALLMLVVVSTWAVAYKLVVDGSIRSFPVSTVRGSRKDEDDRNSVAVAIAASDLHALHAGIELVHMAVNAAWPIRSLGVNSLLWVNEEWWRLYSITTVIIFDED